VINGCGRFEVWNDAGTGEVSTSVIIIQPRANGGMQPGVFILVAVQFDAMFVKLRY
jgi:hypothetical protein